MKRLAILLLLIGCRDYDSGGDLVGPTGDRPDSTWMCQSGCASKGPERCKDPISFDKIWQFIPSQNDSSDETIRLPSRDIMRHTTTKL